MEPLIGVAADICSRGYQHTYYSMMACIGVVRLISSRSELWYSVTVILFQGLRLLLFGGSLEFLLWRLGMAWRAQVGCRLSAFI